MFKYLSISALVLALLLLGVGSTRAESTASGISDEGLSYLQAWASGLQTGTGNVNAGNVSTGGVNTGTFSATGFVQAGQKVGIGPAHYLQNLVADLTVYSDSFAQMYLRTGQGANSGGYFINAESTTANGSTDQQFYVLQNGQLWAKKLCVGNDGCIDKWNGVNVSEGGGSGSSGGSGGNISPAGINTGAINISGDGPIFRIDDKSHSSGGGQGSAYFSMDDDISRLVMKGGEIVVQGTGPGVNGAGGSGGSIQANQYCIKGQCSTDGFFPGMLCGMSSLGVVTSLPIGLAPYAQGIPCPPLGTIPPICTGDYIAVYLAGGLVGGHSSCMKVK